MRVATSTHPGRVMPPSPTSPRGGGEHCERCMHRCGSRLTHPFHKSHCFESSQLQKSTAMDLLSALSHILDSFGFDEQASACRRLQESGSVAFKDESIQWQQWALDAEAKTGSTVSFQEYDLWARSRSTVLKIFDQLAMPMSITPPLMFDILGTTTESSGNSFTKVLCPQLIAHHHIIPLLCFYSLWNSTIYSSVFLSGSVCCHPCDLLHRIVCDKGMSWPANES
jgi:hypothetical protein